MHLHHSEFSSVARCRVGIHKPVSVKRERRRVRSIDRAGKLVNCCDRAVKSEALAPPTFARACVCCAVVSVCASLLTALSMALSICLPVCVSLYTVSAIYFIPLHIATV